MVRSERDVERAKVWLKAHLKGHGGSDTVKNIIANLKKLDLTKGEIKQARKELGLTSERYGNSWYWYL